MSNSNILGLDSAVKEAKSLGVSNMTISAPLVLEMAERIAELERYNVGLANESCELQRQVSELQKVASE